MGQGRKANDTGGEAEEKEGKKRERPPPPPRYSAAWFLDWGRTLVYALVIFLVLRTFLAASFVIDSGSMEDTLLVGDFLLVNRLPFGTPVPLTGLRVPGYREPARGDIVVFRNHHSPGLDIVKRVMGLAGDTVGMRDGVLYRNGAALEEPYVRRDLLEPAPVDSRLLWHTEHMPEPWVGEYEPTRIDWGPVVVPEDHLFMLGDNRDQSFDSRFWGFVKRENMRGAPAFIYYSYDKDALRPLRFVTALRPGRFGRVPR